jgi:hypothetical protein
MVWLAGCGGSSTPTSAPKPEPVARPISVVTSSLVVEDCPAPNRVDSKRAGKEIDALVAGCQSIPGGTAHFSATLLPDGRVQFGSPAGDPAQGVIPTCLLQTKNPLRHRLRLAKPCKLDVQLEEQKSG